MEKNYFKKTILSKIYKKKNFREIDFTKNMIDANCCTQALMLRMAVIYIVVNIIYIPASRLKSASTSTKLFASVRIKRPHKPQLTVNKLGLPGIQKYSSINQKKLLEKQSKFFGSIHDPCLPVLQLSDPNPNSPANSMAAQLVKENRREYEKRVKACVE